MAIREVADAWASLYSNSVALRSLVTFVHVGGLMTGGGTAISADLGILSALRRGQAAVQPELARLRRTHRLVVGSLAVVVASGLLLLLKDLDALLESRAYWIKMGLFVALLLNGLLLVRVEGRAERGESRAVGHLRLVCLASVVLWLATALAGTVVPNAL